MHQLFTFSKLKPLFSESIRLIHHITTKPSLAFTTQTLEANIFQGGSLRRVLIHIVRACCFLSANVILRFDYVDNFLLPFRASGSRGSGVRMCNWIARIKSMFISDFFQYYFILFFNFSFRTIPISSKPTFNFGMK